VPLATAATALVCWFVAALAWPSSPTVVDTAVYSAVTTVAFLAVAFVLRLIPKELRSALLRRRIAV
jgi:hypothetical protein